MPTPSEETVHSTPIVETAPTSSSRNSFASCPPDDEREHHVSRSERGSLSRSTMMASAGAAESEMESNGRGQRHEIAEQSTPEPDVESGASERIPSPSEREKGEHIEDSGSLFVDPTSPTVASSDVPSDSDGRLAQSMLTTTISPSTPPPQYLHFPELDLDRTTSSTSTTSFLRPGSKFKGTQQSDRQVYEVQVELKDVNLAESFLCGYLRIQGLTDDHPTLTTFFEGEIIGPKYLFKTTHPSWGSSEKVDLQHWARFPAWRPLAKSAKLPHFTLKNYQQREHLFMRWKEYFLVPDHRVKTITGASFEGFYYICFNQCSGTVSGIYFHAKSEKYQQLELRHVDERGCLPAMEFR